LLKIYGFNRREYEGFMLGVARVQGLCTLIQILLEVAVFLEPLL